MVLEIQKDIFFEPEITIKMPRTAWFLEFKEGSLTFSDLMTPCTGKAQTIEFLLYAIYFPAQNFPVVDCVSVERESPEIYMNS